MNVFVRYEAVALPRLVGAAKPCLEWKLGQHGHLKGLVMRIQSGPGLHGGPWPHPTHDTWQNSGTTDNPNPSPIQMP